MHPRRQKPCSEAVPQTQLLTFCEYLHIYFYNQINLETECCKCMYNQPNKATWSSYWKARSPAVPHLWRLCGYYLWVHMLLELCAHEELVTWYVCVVRTLFSLIPRVSFSLTGCFFNLNFLATTQEAKQSPLILHHLLFALYVSILINHLVALGRTFQLSFASLLKEHFTILCSLFY